MTNITHNLVLSCYQELFSCDMDFLESRWNHNSVQIIKSCGKRLEKLKSQSQTPEAKAHRPSSSQLINC